MPPHNRAAEVRVSNRHKKRTLFAFFFGTLISGRSTRAIKKERFCVLFWRLGVVRRPAFSKCASGLGLPKNSVVCKLVYINTTRPDGHPTKLILWGPRKEVSWHIVPPHNRAAGVRVSNRHKKRTLLAFFLARLYWDAQHAQ